MELDNLQQFEDLKDIDFAKKFNLKRHSFMLDENLFNRCKVLADGEEGLRNLKWSFSCNNNAIMYTRNF